jgi:hypothetical protein
MVLALLHRKFSLLAWDISTDQEEPWRRFLQELQELSGSRYQEYAESRRHPKGHRTRDRSGSEEAARRVLPRLLGVRVFVLGR